MTDKCSFVMTFFDFLWNPIEVDDDYWWVCCYPRLNTGFCHEFRCHVECMEEPMPSFTVRCDGKIEPHLFHVRIIDTKIQIHFDSLAEVRRFLRLNSPLAPYGIYTETGERCRWWPDMMDFCPTCKWYKESM